MASPTPEEELCARCGEKPRHWMIDLCEECGEADFDYGGWDGAHEQDPHG